mmetsp:Transcript_4171/g.12765  ORF Transcript_4171/g.12765 Transcript_4171/m.12765 type:complete len:204 (-) Transcript_4171:1033-1644(-)
MCDISPRRDSTRSERGGSRGDLKREDGLGGGELGGELEELDAVDGEGVATVEEGVGGAVGGAGSGGADLEGVVESDGEAAAAAAEAEDVVARVDEHVVLDRGQRRGIGRIEGGVVIAERGVSVGGVGAVARVVVEGIGADPAIDLALVGLGEVEYEALSGAEIVAGVPEALVDEGAGDVPPVVSHQEELGPGVGFSRVRVEGL